MNAYKLGSAGESLIKEFESLELVAYLDMVGIPTIGWGHTANVTRADVANKLTITEQKAQEYFVEDTRFAVDCVLRVVTVDITQLMFDALVSFVFNVGPGRKANPPRDPGKDGFAMLAVGRPSTMLRKLLEKDFDGASNQFSAWVYAGTNTPVAGLVRRRADERLLFRRGANLSE